MKLFFFFMLINKRRGEENRINSNEKKNQKSRKEKRMCGVFSQMLQGMGLKKKKKSKEEHRVHTHHTHSTSKHLEHHLPVIYHPSGLPTVIFICLSIGREMEKEKQVSNEKKKPKNCLRNK